MTTRQIRTTLFFLGVCVLAIVTGLQVVRSLPHSGMFFIMGLALVFIVMEPFAGLIVYLAFYFVRPWAIIPGFEGVPALLIIGAATLVSMLVWQGVKRGAFVRVPQDYLIIWFLLAIVVSHVFHGHFDLAVRYGYVFVHVVIAYLLITNLVSSVHRFKIVMHTLGLVMVWMAVQGLMLRYAGIGIGGMTMAGERVRVLGLTKDPNLLAAGLLLLLPFFVFEMTRVGGFWRRLYSAIAVVVLTHVIFLTESRAGGLAFAALTIALLVRSLGVLRAAVLGSAMLVAIYYLGPARLHELGTAEPSAFGRLVVWKRTLGEFQASPVFGIGSHQSGQGMELVPHSAFLQAASELGLFGLVPWLTLIIVSMKNALFVSNCARGTEHTEIGLLMEALFLGYGAWLIALLFAGSPYYDEFYIVAGLCVAGSIVFVKRGRSRYKLMEKRDFGYAVLLAALGLVTYGLYLRVLGV
jgi:hypothetical protein